MTSKLSYDRRRISKEESNRGKENYMTEKPEHKLSYLSSGQWEVRGQACCGTVQWGIGNIRRNKKRGQKSNSEGFTHQEKELKKKGVRDKGMKSCKSTREGYNRKNDK